MHLIIIDALNLIRRLHAAQGSPCLAGCRSIIQQVLHNIQPTHAVAVFDNETRQPGWRHQLLPGYKAGRPPMPASLVTELPLLQQMFTLAGVQCWSAEQDEADDLAATLAVKMARAGHKTTLISTDRGYCQILVPGIQIRDYFQKRWLDPSFVQQTFGVAAAQLPDYWGLCGISSSKIPGITGIGPKNAQALLAQFGSLSAIYQHLDALPPALQRKLAGQQILAETCRQVASLRSDLQLQRNLSTLRYTG